MRRMRSLTKMILGAGCLALSLAGCSSQPPPPVDWGAAPSIEAFTDTLARRSEPADAIRASLFLAFEGGFLEEERLRIHGQMAQVWPGRFRLIGQYGALRKVFDLRVRGDRFQLYDHREHVLYVGDAYDAVAAEDLGFALRPGDLGRLMRLGGLGPVEDARIREIAPDADSITVAFSLPDDPARWTAVFDSGDLRLLRLERGFGGPPELRVTYHDHARSGNRWVPQRVLVTRPTGDERVEIDVRTVRVEDDLPDELFEFEVPEGAEIVHLGRMSQKAIDAP